MGLLDSWSVKDFDIHLSSTTLVPGQTISGNVVFTVTSEMSFRNVTIKVIGREYTHVRIWRSTGQSAYAEDFYGKRNFFKVHLTALGMPKGGEKWKGTLAPGSYNFPFSFQIPDNGLPTTVNHDGENSTSVQYYVKAHVDIPFSFNSDKEAHFHVNTAMPTAQSLTAGPYSSMPFRAERKCCCCCSRGYTNLTFAVDKNLIIFGSDTVLNGTISIDNVASSEAAKEIKVALIQQTPFIAKGHSRVAVTVIASTKITPNVKAKQDGVVTTPFQLVLNAPQSPDHFPLPCNFKGELLTNTYRVTFVCDGDQLGQCEILAASSLSDEHWAAPVQTETVSGTTVGKGQYPRFIYAAPPGGASQVPEQAADNGPFHTGLTQIQY
eukprot:GILI01021641.1.p1 GENE.GILI01021641.1~~GILI01021641.1.p1  ORF type:complete len:379 (-),score=46.52 GILI01021641.1:246-1382(-)